LTTLAPWPVWSEVYKWVDEDGVVNYSNQPPSNGKAQELDLNSVTLSVIETDKIDRRVAMAAQSEVGALRQKVEQLESRLEAERYTRGYPVDSVTMPVVEYGYPYGYPGYLYAPGVVYVQHHLRKSQIFPTNFIRTPMTSKHSFSGMQPAGFRTGMTPSFVNVR